MRFKNRYFLCELCLHGLVDQTLTAYHIYSAVKNSVAANFGDFGLGSVMRSLQVKYFNNLTNLCIIRSSRSHHKMVWTALSLVTSVKDHAATLRTLHLGGTIRSCKAAAMKFNRLVLLELVGLDPKQLAADRLLEAPQGQGEDASLPLSGRKRTLQDMLADAQEDLDALET